MLIKHVQREAAPSVLLANVNSVTNFYRPCRIEKKKKERPFFPSLPGL